MQMSSAPPISCSPPQGWPHTSVTVGPQVHIVFLKHFFCHASLLCPLLLRFLPWYSKTVASFRMTVPSRSRWLDFWPAHIHSSVWFLVSPCQVPTGHSFLLVSPHLPLVVPDVSSGLSYIVPMFFEKGRHLPPPAPNMLKYGRSTLPSSDGFSYMCF